MWINAASCNRVLLSQPVHNKLDGMAANSYRGLVRLAGMVILAVGLVFAPFAAAHAASCADGPARTHALLQKHSDAMSGHTHRHSDPSHLAAGSCCVSVCSICTAPVGSGTSEFQLVSHPVVYLIQVSPLTGNAVPPGLDPPRIAV
jgi:hypothetical protein